MNVGTAKSGMVAWQIWLLTSINALIAVSSKVFIRHSEMNIFKMLKYILVGRQEHNNVNNVKGRPKGRNSFLLFLCLCLIHFNRKKIEIREFVVKYHFDIKTY